MVYRVTGLMKNPHGVARCGCLACKDDPQNPRKVDRLVDAPNAEQAIGTVETFFSVKASWLEGPNVELWTVETPLESVLVIE